MKKYIIITVLLFTIILSACTVQSPDVPQATATETSQSTGMEEESSDLPEPSPTTAAVEVEATTAVEVEATTAVEVQAEEFVVKQGLEASPLDGVTIASGDVQLIEFFAFW